MNVPPHDHFSLSNLIVEKNDVHNPGFDGLVDNKNANEDIRREEDMSDHQNRIVENIFRGQNRKEKTNKPTCRSD